MASAEMFTQQSKHWKNEFATNGDEKKYVRFISLDGQV